jgi:hypothetical protein
MTVFPSQGPTLAKFCCMRFGGALERVMESNRTSVCFRNTNKAAERPQAGLGSFCRRLNERPLSTRGRRESARAQTASIGHARRRIDQMRPDRLVISAATAISRVGSICIEQLTDNLSRTLRERTNPEHRGGWLSEPLGSLPKRACHLPANRGHAVQTLILVRDRS